MPYQVTIRDNNTGEVRETTMDLDIASFHLYWWTYGNFGCDCNRCGEFYSRDPVPEQDVVCGDTRFDLLKIDLGDGRVFDNFQELNPGRPQRDPQPPPSL